MQYCEKMLNMVPSSELLLGRTEDSTKETMQYVSILETIKEVFKNEDIVSHILQCEKKRNSSEDLLFDYTDGSLFQEHSFFGTASNFLKLRLYFYIDEFEVVNPLGSQCGKHKLTAMYFTFGNMHPKYRSKLEYMYLCILVQYKYVKKYTYFDILKTLFKELNVLENTGVEINYTGQKLIVKGTVATISADNLSAHDLAGFQTHFHTDRICRFCMATKEDIMSKVCEEDFVLRITDVHQYHLNAVEENVTDAAIYGVRR